MAIATEYFLAIACRVVAQMELEKAFAEERAVWWTLEERGTRSASASPRGSLTGARALRRGDFASQRSASGTASNGTDTKAANFTLFDARARLSTEFPCWVDANKVIGLMPTRQTILIITFYD